MSEHHPEDWQPARPALRSIAHFSLSGNTLPSAFAVSLLAARPLPSAPAAQAWGIRTIITALIAFFPTKADGALAGLDYTATERKKLALASRRWQCAKCARPEAADADADAYADADADAVPTPVPRSLFGTPRPSLLATDRPARPLRLEAT